MRAILASMVLCVSACKSTKPAGPPQPGGGIRLAGHSSNGLNLGLGDGSRWQVQPVGQGRVLHWMPGDPILVQRIVHPSFPFRLVNLRNQSATLARYTGRGPG